MISILLISLSLLAAEPHKDCIKWFIESGTKQGTNCELNCSIVETDLNTYFCSNQCSNLCKLDLKTEPEPPPNIYGLTDDEIKICKRDPVLCAQAYKQSWEAESLCEEIYIKSSVNDESDACRHFIWAALLTNSHGQKIATEILDAHENNPKEPLDQKAMDLANNRAGALAGEQLRKNKEFNNINLKKEFLKQLESGSLIIIAPGTKPKPRVP